MSTNINNNNTDQTTKVVPLFTTKVNVSDKSSKKGDRHERLIAPKNLIAQTSNHKPHLDVGYHRVASAFVKQFKGLSNEEFKSKAESFGISSENFKDYVKAASNVFGDEQFGQLVSQLLQENGVSLDDANAALAIAGYMNDDFEGGNLETVKSAAEHFTSAVHGINPFLLAVSMGQKQSQIENQGLANEARQSQAENNKLSKVNSSMSAKAGDIQSAEKSQPWWKRVIKLVVVVVAAAALTALLTCLIPGSVPVEAAIDTEIAGDLIGGGLADAGEAADALGSAVNETVVEDGSTQIEMDTFESGASNEVSGLEEKKDPLSSKSEDGDLNTEETANSVESPTESEAEVQAANEEEHKKVKETENRVKAEHEEVQTEKDLTNDKSQTKDVNKSGSDKVGGEGEKKVEMKRKFGKHFTLKRLLMGTLMGTLTGAGIWNRITSANQNAKVSKAQTDAMSLQNVAQGIDNTEGMITAETNAYLQGLSTINMGQATALNYAYTADTVKA